MTDLTFASILPTLTVSDVGRTRDLLTGALPFEIASGSAAHAVLTLNGHVGVKLVRGQAAGPVEATIALGGTTGLEGLYATVVRFIGDTGDATAQIELDEIANVGWGKRQFRLTLLPERHVLQFVQDKVIPQC